MPLGAEICLGRRPALAIRGFFRILLVSYRVIVDLIAATTTKTGLTVKCELDSAHYPKGVAVSPKQMDNLNITRDAFHGEWNYTIHPAEMNTEPVKAVIFG